MYTCITYILYCIPNMSSRVQSQKRHSTQICMDVALTKIKPLLHSSLIH